MIINVQRYKNLFIKASVILNDRSFHVLILLVIRNFYLEFRYQKYLNNAPSKLPSKNQPLAPSASG